MSNISEKALKNKYDYITRYQKENYKMFSAQLKRDEYKDLKELLELKHLGNAEFVRYAYEKLLSGEI